MHPIDLIRFPRNRLKPLVLLFAILPLQACEGPPRQAAPVPVACDSEGFLHTDLYGAIRTSIRWGTESLACEGMPRPDGAGARLRLSGPIEDAPDAGSVAFILGLPDLVRGEPGHELPTNVTLIQEGTGRFFGTPDTSGCWTDIERQEPLEPGNTVNYRVSGTVYCVSPLAELNGGANISFTELTFTGRLDWEIPE